jgi:predicted aconitase with swiveling domain
MEGDGISSKSDDVALCVIATNRLVAGDYDNNNNCDQYQHGHQQNTPTTTIHPVLYSDVPLSFWGGIDERTGIVIDSSHPLCGENVSDTILVLPSGRGSCTASQVLLELILNRKSPRALILRDRDGLVCMGALVARCVLGLEKSQQLHDDDTRSTSTSTSSSVPVLDVLQVRNNDADDTTICNGNTATATTTTTTTTTTFDTLIESQPKYGSILSDGKFVVGQTIEEVEEKLDLLLLQSSLSSLKDEESKEDLNEIVSDENYSSNDEDFDIDFDFDFKLTLYERQMLNDASTEAELRAVEVLIRYARIVTPPSSTPTYIDVTRAHIDGCTYIGPGGLRFVEKLVEDGGRVKIP